MQPEHCLDLTPALSSEERETVFHRDAYSRSANSPRLLDIMLGENREGWMWGSRNKLDLTPPFSGEGRASFALEEVTGS